jgi:hypothetical protein
METSAKTAINVEDVFEIDHSIFSDFFHLSQINILKSFRWCY